MELKQNMYLLYPAWVNSALLMISKVRIPWADGTVVKAPDEIADSALVLMADIFPTGCFAAKNAFKELTKEEIAEATVVVIGCG